MLVCNCCLHDYINKGYSGITRSRMLM